MAKSNEFRFRSQRPENSDDFSPPEKRGRLVSLCTPEDIDAAKKLGYTVLTIRTCFINSDSKWETRCIIASNNDSYNVIPFSDKDQAREISWKITQAAELLRRQKHK